MPKHMGLLIIAAALAGVTTAGMRLERANYSKYSPPTKAGAGSAGNGKRRHPGGKRRR